MRFFERPEEFLFETISNLAPDCRAAIAVVFMNGGHVRSPVPAHDLEPAARAFGVNVGAVREQLETLNGSLLLLAQDEAGSYWAYKHPTVSDAFARYVARSAELVEIYLRGAKPDSIVREVVCGGNYLLGAPVTVPDSLHDLLADRIGNLDRYRLVSFLSYRSNRSFSALLLKRRPDILSGLKNFCVPIKDDTDASLVATLHEQGLLPENIRQNFVREFTLAATEEADASFIDDSTLESVLTDFEKEMILAQLEHEVLANIPGHVNRLRRRWESDCDPEEYFEYFYHSIELFVEALADKSDHKASLLSARSEISQAVASRSYS